MLSPSNSDLNEGVSDLLSHGAFYTISQVERERTPLAASSRRRLYLVDLYLITLLEEVEAATFRQARKSTVEAHTRPIAPDHEVARASLPIPLAPGRFGYTSQTDIPHPPILRA